MCDASLKVERERVQKLSAAPLNSVDQGKIMTAVMHRDTARPKVETTYEWVFVVVVVVVVF